MAKSKSTKADSTPKAESTPKKAAAADKNASTDTAKASDSTKAAETPKSEAADAGGTPKNYSRGEGQKAVTQAYRDNWNAIFGDKKKKR